MLCCLNCRFQNVFQLRSLCRVYSQRVLRKISQSVPFGVIHGDPFLDNVHVDNDTGAFIGERIIAPAELKNPTVQANRSQTLDCCTGLMQVGSTLKTPRLGESSCESGYLALSGYLWHGRCTVSSLLESTRCIHCGLLKAGSFRRGLRSDRQLLR